jgi:hypothetical protein
LDDSTVNEAEALKTIGELIVAGRVAMDVNQKPFAALAGVAIKTLDAMEKGRSVGWHTSQQKVEKALGWRTGSIQKVIDDAEHIPAGSLTLAAMKEGAGEATWGDLADEEDAKRIGPVTRASKLTDEELLAELAYRFRNYKDRFNGES